MKEKFWINLKDKAGNTALHFAAFCGHEKCVKKILEYNGDTKAR